MNKKNFILQSTFAPAGLLSASLKLNPSDSGNYPVLNISNPDQPNICTTCGTRYSPDKHYEQECPVCLDDRQYVKASGQQWVSYNSLLDQHSIRLKKHTDQVYEITTLPGFAIGQSAFFIQTDTGNMLWDCIPLITQPIVDFIQRKGGIQAIAISHPHYYSLMAEWAKVFQCPIYIHQADQQWVMDTEAELTFWDKAEYPLNKNASLIHTGGHFPGSAILQVKLNDLGEAIFIGDSLFLSRDKQHLSAMYSYPNVIPLTNAETLRVFSTVAQYTFNALFGAFGNQYIYEGARELFDNSYRNYQLAFRND